MDVGDVVFATVMLFSPCFGRARSARLPHTTFFEDLLTPVLICVPVECSRPKALDALVRSLDGLSRTSARR